MNHSLQLILAASLVVAFSGCSPEPAATRENPPVSTKKVETAPSEVEIGKPILAWRDSAVLTFEIPYEFKSGSPHKVYRWAITFPGTGELGNRDTEAWEMKSDGVQKTALQLGSNTMEKYSIELFEAKSPESPYYSISNIVTGDVPKFSEAEAAATESAR